MTYFQKRVKQGLDNEDYLKEYIEEDLNIKLDKTQKFVKYDFINIKEKMIVELKTREVIKNQYKTTIIGKDKIDFFLKKIQEGFIVYLYFGFKDGLYKIKLEEEIFNTFQISNIGCRFRENKKPHYEIPVDKLEFVNKISRIEGDYTEVLKKKLTIKTFSENVF